MTSFYSVISLRDHRLCRFFDFYKKPRIALFPRNCEIQNVFQTQEENFWFFKTTVVLLFGTSGIQFFIIQSQKEHNLQFAVWYTISIGYEHMPTPGGESYDRSTYPHIMFPPSLLYTIIMNKRYHKFI